MNNIDDDNNNNNHNHDHNIDDINNNSINYYQCNTQFIDKRYPKEWFISNNKNLKNITKYIVLFLDTINIIESNDYKFIKQLNKVLLNEYWCYSFNNNYDDAYNNKIIFPYHNPFVIAFTSHPLNQFISNFYYNLTYINISSSIILSQSLESTITSSSSSSSQKTSLKSNFINNDNKYYSNKDFTQDIYNNIHLCTLNQTCLKLYINEVSFNISTFDISKFWFIGITEYIDLALFILKYKLRRRSNHYHHHHHHNDQTTNHHDHDQDIHYESNIDSNDVDIACDCNQTDNNAFDSKSNNNNKMIVHNIIMANKTIVNTILSYNLSYLHIYEYALRRFLLQIYILESEIGYSLQAICNNTSKISSSSNDSNININNSHNDDDQEYRKNLLYIHQFSCSNDLMKKRYTPIWFRSRNIELIDMKPVIFMNLFNINYNNNNNASLLLLFLNKLELLLINDYWCQSDVDLFKSKYDRSIFPYKSPKVLIFLRKPMDQFYANYKYSYDLYQALSLFTTTSTIASTIASIIRSNNASDEYLNHKKHHHNDNEKHHHHHHQHHQQQQLQIPHYIGFPSNNINDCLMNNLCINYYSNSQSNIVGYIDISIALFVGIYEYYEASLCVLNYVLGRLPDDYICDCNNNHDEFYNNNNNNNTSYLSSTSFSYSSTTTPTTNNAIVVANNATPVVSFVQHHDSNNINSDDNDNNNTNNVDSIILSYNSGDLHLYNAGFRAISRILHWMELDSGIYINNKNCNNITMKRLQDHEHVDVGILDEYTCEEKRMLRKYNTTWLKSKKISMRRIQPYFFLHIHKAAGLSIVKELIVLLKNEYWCQSEKSYDEIYNNKIIFPYKKPLVITFLRKPMDQFISSYRYKLDLYLSLGYEINDIKLKRKFNLLSSIDNCVVNKLCFNNYLNFESKTIGNYNNLSSKFWFLGITEYYYTSICMLKYKLSQYNYNECQCNLRDIKYIRHEDHHSSHKLTIKSISNNTLNIIRTNSSQDIYLYNLGLRYFYNEVLTLRTISSMNSSSSLSSTSSSLSSTSLSSSSTSLSSSSSSSSLTSLSSSSSSLSSSPSSSSSGIDFNCNSLPIITIADEIKSNKLYIDQYLCDEQLLKKRYSNFSLFSMYINSSRSSSALEYIQPYLYYNLFHYHDINNIMIIKKLEKILKNQYWCQSNQLSMITNKTIFPLLKQQPYVITFLQTSTQQFLNNFIEKQNNYLFLGYTIDELKFIKKFKYISNINYCIMIIKSCFEYFMNKQFLSSLIKSSSSKMRSGTASSNIDIYKILSKFWFIGLSDYIDISLCILKYKLKSINSHKDDDHDDDGTDKCDCNNRKMKNFIFPHNHHNYHHYTNIDRNQRYNNYNYEITLTNQSINQILSHSILEIKLYNYACDIFYQNMLQLQSSYTNLHLNCTL
jgi:hypothetical protein